MTLYRAKQTDPIEAIQFQYTDDGIKALRLFAGDSLGAISKARHSGSIAEASINVIELATLKPRKVVFEKEWLIKAFEGDSVGFIVCNEELFHSAYEAID